MTARKMRTSDCSNLPLQACLPALDQATVCVAHTEQQSMGIDVCCVTAGCNVASPELFSTAASVPLQAGGLIKPISAGTLAWNHSNLHQVDTNVTNLSDCCLHLPLSAAYSFGFGMSAFVLQNQPPLLLQAAAGPHALQSPEGHRCCLPAQAARLPAQRLGRAALYRPLAPCA